MGNISFAKTVIDPSHEAFNPLEKAENASLRAADLAKKLLIFAKGGQPLKKPVSLQKIVKDSVALALRGTTIPCRIDFKQSLHVVEADEGQLSHVFHNIAVNAIEAMPNGGRLDVEGGNVTLPAENSLRLPAGEYVSIAVIDSGCGIPASDLKNVFDPYFSTKPGGAGLGLSSAHAVITKHGGKITVDSSVGEGTTFTIYLPASVSTGSTGQKIPDNIADKSKLRILVMDDEEMVRDIASLMLERLGYTAVTCSNGDEAVSEYSAAKEAGTPFFAVIMDLTIPGGMGGVEAARLILDRDPDALLIVSSGYSDDPAMSDYRDYGFTAAMGKPYKIESIAQVLKECSIPGS